MSNKSYKYYLKRQKKMKREINKEVEEITKDNIQKMSFLERIRWIIGNILP